MLDPERLSAERRGLASALRELRLASGLSGERLALKAAMSQAKVSRIENGKVLPTVLDVERILSALDVEPDLSAELLALAREANTDYQTWRRYARIGLHHKQTELRSLEESSHLMRHFLPAVPTGLLHVPEYARATLTANVASDPSGNLARTIEARLRRQEILKDSSRRFIFLMTEQAVRWRQCPSAVIAAQCEHMADLSRLPNVDIAVIAADRLVPMSPLNIFVIYDERLVTIELFSGEIVLKDPRDVRRHVELFEFFYSHALQGEDATTFLREVARDLSDS